jgi:hypothetical protein
MLLALVVSIRECRSALALASPTVSANNHDLLPTTKGRIAFSTGLESSGQVPLSRNRTRSSSADSRLVAVDLASFAFFDVAYTCIAQRTLAEHVRAFAA